ncbi:MAG TPA: DUF5694 domain-containing protein [Gemmatimonadales bacterium]|nr:DUF5694 domain-containing protein [Gemmatimonadales bacterium]
MMQRLARLMLLVGLALGAGAVRGTRASAQQVLLLGTFHFDNPNLDRYKQRHAVDILSAQRQREVEAVVARLAAFRPTHVAVEWPRAKQAALDSLYREYRAGRYALGPSEVFQLGFRLAARLGHERVYAVDTERDASFIALARAREAELEAADAADTVWNARYQRLYAHDDSLKAVQPLGAHLRHLNAPARIREGHGAYLVRLFRAGGDSSYAGPDFTAGWYDRNLRIYRNLQRLGAAPTGRIVVVYGAGHLGVLRHLVESSPEFALVEAGRYLR